MKNKVALYFLLSIFVHAIGILVLNLLKGQGPNLKSYSEPMTVSLMEPDNSESLQSSRQNSEPKSVTSNETQKELNTSEIQAMPLTQKLNFTGKSSAEIFENQHNADSSKSATGNNSYFQDNEFRPTKDTYDKYSSHGAYGYTEAGGIKKIFEQSSFYTEVWKRIRQNANFPKDFLAFRLQGKVRIHALVNEKGQLIGDFLNVSVEADPVLALYSMAVLSLSLEKPLPKTFWIKDKQIPMVFEFNFRHVYNIADLPPPHMEKEWRPEYQQANSLKFESSRFVDPILVDKIKELYLDYFPPVMPLAGGLMIDIGLLYAKYTHWKKHGFKLPSEVKNEELRSLRQQILAALKKPNKDLLGKLSNGNFNQKDEMDNSQNPRSLLLQEVNPNSLSN